MLRKREPTKTLTLSDDWVIAEAGVRYETYIINNGVNLIQSQLHEKQAGKKYGDVQTTPCLKKTSLYFTSRSLVKHYPILIIFGRNILEIYWPERVVSFPTSPNLCSCITWENKKNVNMTFAFYSIVLFGQSNITNHI